MTEYSAEKLESILGKVRALIQRADHPNTPPAEAESARNMAEALMFKYRLDEATAVAGYKGDSDGGLKPVWRTIVLGNATSEFKDYYSMLAGTVISHVGARGVTNYEYNEMTKQHDIVLKAVGYESDLRYMDLLLTASLLEFSKRLEPKYDPNLSDEDNAYYMRSAGMERRRIAALIFGPWETENEMKAKNRKVTNLFKSACAKRGEDASVLLGRGNNVKTFRKSYADGFVNQFHNRLLRMRQAQGAESGALVLASRKENVDEAYYTEFPQYRPKPVDPNAKPSKVRYRKGPTRSFNWNAYDRGADAARAVDLGPNATGTSRMRPADEKKGLGQ